MKNQMNLAAQILRTKISTMRGSADGRIVVRWGETVRDKSVVGMPDSKAFRLCPICKAYD